MAAPGGARRRPLLLLLFAGLVHGASAVFVVKNGNGTACIMADFSATFLTSYDTRSGPQNKSFELPAGAEVSNSSSCGKENASDSSLVITFGRGHTLTLIFTRNATRYEVQLMRFAYNLSDTDTFPNSSSTGVKTVESATDIKADINKTYRCVSETQVNMDNVTVTLRDAAIQAYLSSSNFSREETRCEQDLPTPTTPPQPAPTPAPASPAVFRYNVSGSNGTCLLASMGLQLNVTYRRVDNKTVTREFNVNPNKTTFGGNCSATLATLELHSENLLLLALQFVMNESSSRVFLQGVQLNLTLPDAKEGSFTATNSSLRALQATAGNSYKCNAEQRLRVTSSFSLNMFRVWLQAFRVDGDKFGPVEECQLDENSMLIPIAVGGALAGLVLIVLLAYLIGRKRSHAGYQTI
ncbi:lysosome-associated membrane glycoprotein 1 [Bos indicus]|uniref:Lysosome-associated membrane glycoprotein 1 n=4 Tax=Bos TaxID=9903 RepID=LAMP1_BOVIN|nr:lysosome-associated membrane glycoprotein 1 precursor [Bos taurus]XP_019827344.1 PREDICTED: lysosome-associated membrane glycoprotein 1 [Bos indicus]XP_027413832.1 lysosome-associated membrane glycoprotein 1 [Bos indicus x Bos taurus]Q05204.2 RecName: Full=Lysosome-associated membrane glycoprotein 1; Short=LAMP-1; Short=Lysosome-associated membrane protein 1; AltName: Full=CD107 antigen-like family member A; AltName: Full=Chromaffin granule-associated membrane glycoprotein IIA; AltName: CD_an